MMVSCSNKCGIPGKLLMGGVREFGYLRPKNRQICVHKFDYLRAILARLCSKNLALGGHIFAKIYYEQHAPNIE